MYGAWFYGNDYFWKIVDSLLALRVIEERNTLKLYGWETFENKINKILMQVKRKTKIIKLFSQLKDDIFTHLIHNWDTVVNILNDLKHLISIRFFFCNFLVKNINDICKDYNQIIIKEHQSNHFIRRSPIPKKVAHLKREKYNKKC